jgi:hypothetical protein
VGQVNDEPSGWAKTIPKEEHMPQDEQDEVDVNRLLEHVSKIEKANRYWRLATLFLLLLLASSMTTTLRSQENLKSFDPRGKTLGPPDLRAPTVQSERFQLMDNGSVRAELAMSNGSPVLELYDAAGKVIWSTRARTETVKR